MRGAGDFYRLQAELSNEVEDATAEVEGWASQRPHCSAQRVCGCSIWQVEQETPPVGLDDRETPSRSKHAEHFRQCLIGVRDPLQRLARTGTHQLIRAGRESDSASPIRKSTETAASGRTLTSDSEHRFAGIDWRSPSRTLPHPSPARLATSPTPTAGHRAIVHSA
jgi:hypothetical protein